jgi:hypothetical protein
MRKPAIVILVVFVLVSGCLATGLPSVAAQSRCALTIRNGSNRTFHRLHVSWSRDKDWGANLLQEVLRPGMSMTRRDMVPADYDVLLVDGNNQQCTLRGVKVYNDMTLTITEALLSNQCR